MDESKISFEEIAAQQEQGARPDGNVESQQFTMSETAKADAQKLLEEGKKAKETGDQQALERINQQITHHPEIGKVVGMTKLPARIELQGDGKGTDFTRSERTEAETIKKISEELVMDMELAKQAVDIVTADAERMKPEKEGGRFIDSGVEANVYAVDINGQRYVVKEYMNPNMDHQRDYTNRLKKAQDLMIDAQFYNFAPIQIIDSPNNIYLVQRRFDAEGDMTEMNDLLREKGLAIQDIDNNVYAFWDENGEEHPVLIDFSMVARRK
jgi:hypothetical protein